jgi:uncharacterized protein (DUF2249 family)
MPVARNASVRSTPLHRHYDMLKDGLDEGEQTRLAEAHQRDPAPLIQWFRESVAAFAAPIEEPFYPSSGLRKDPADPKYRTRVTEINSTIKFAAHICDGRPLAVENADQLAFRYVDREISPLRTKLSEKMDRFPRRSLDLLFANAQDGRPIFAELKIRGDSLPYFALIQVLALASDLLPRPQLERLDRYYPEQFAWPDEGPFADLYIIAFNPEKGTYYKASFDATERISEKLMASREVSSLVRRIAYFEAGDDLVFSKRFEFPADA